MKDKELLVAEGVVREYLLPRQSLLSSRPKMRALDGVSLRLGKGESFGIVGESGCGKSTLARTVMGLEPPQNGRILFQGEDLYAISPENSNPCVEGCRWSSRILMVLLIQGIPSAVRLQNL